MSLVPHRFLVGSSDDPLFVSGQRAHSSLKDKLLRFMIAGISDRSIAYFRKSLQKVVEKMDKLDFSESL